MVKIIFLNEAGVHYPEVGVVLDPEVDECFGQTLVPRWHRFSDLALPIGEVQYVGLVLLYKERM